MARVGRRLRAPGDPGWVKRRRRRVLEPVDRPCGRIPEEPRPVDDRSILRRVERNPDHFDPPACRRVEAVVLGGRRAVDTTCELRRRAHAARTVDVDVDVPAGRRGLFSSVCVCEPRQVWTVATWTGASRLLMSKIRTPRNRSGSPLGTPGRAAVRARARLLRGHEEQVLVDRHLTLAARADHGGPDRGVRRVGDVVDLEAVEVPDERVPALEREVRVDETEIAWVRRIEEAGRFRRVREQLEPALGGAWILEARSKALARIACHRPGRDCGHDHRGE